MSGSSISKKLQKLRVPMGFLTAILFVVLSRPTSLTMLIGIPVALIGIGIRAWASGHLRKNKVLTVSGPYAYTRNPLYLGSFILAVGLVVCGGVWWLGLLLLTLFLAIYIPVMKAEIGEMRQLFPDEFPEFEANVPLFLPRLTPWKSGAGKFDTSLYLKYREYRALIGLLIVAAILTIKILVSH